MIPLRWLGDAQEPPIDLLSVFGLLAAEYYNTESSVVDEQRLRQDIEKKYHSLKEIIDPDNYHLYPEEFKTIAQELSQKVDETYILLTDKTKQYFQPNSTLNRNYGKYDLTDYVAYLTITPQKIEPYYARTVALFITLKSSFDNATQNHEKQLRNAQQEIDRLKLENHALKHTFDCIEGYVAATNLGFSYLK